MDWEWWFFSSGVIALLFFIVLFFFAIEYAKAKCCPRKQSYPMDTNLTDIP
jgi:hypothetical protein